MKRLLSPLAGVLLTAALAPTAFAAQPEDIRLDISVVLAGNLTASTTTGTFSAAGGINDGGTEVGAGRFAGQGHVKTGEPNSLHADMTLVGRDGTVAIQLVGLFDTLPAPLADGIGRWVVTDATGAYAGMHGTGSWTAVADFRAVFAGMGPPRVTFALVGQVG